MVDDKATKRIDAVGAATLAREARLKAEAEASGHIDPVHEDIFSPEASAALADPSTEPYGQIGNGA